jgi:hypothetical protein
MLLVKLLDVHCLETVSCYHVLTSINTYYYYYYYYYYCIKNNINVFYQVYCEGDAPSFPLCSCMLCLMIECGTKRVGENNNKGKYNVRVLCLCGLECLCISNSGMILLKLLSEIVNKFPAIYAARSITAVYTRARRLYLSEARRMQTTPTHISRTPTTQHYTLL